MQDICCVVLHQHCSVVGLLVAALAGKKKTGTQSPISESESFGKLEGAI